MSRIRQPRGPELLIRTLAVGYPSGSTLDDHSHRWAQLVYAFEGVMSVHTGEGRWVAPWRRGVWIPADTRHSIPMAGWVSRRTLYIARDLRGAPPRRCRVVGIPPLLRELILHTVAR